MSSKPRVGLFQVVRGLVRATSRLPGGLRAVWHLTTTGPDDARSIGRLIAQWAAKRPDHPAIWDQGRTWTYREFNACANRWAGALRRAGVVRGQAVGVLMENRAELLAAATAVVKLGGVAGMLNHQQRGEVLVHSVNLIRPQALIVGAECAEAFRSIESRLPSGMQVFWLADGETVVPAGVRDLVSEARRESRSDPAQTEQVLARDAAFYVFTSGTTGLPKAAIMSHGRWLKAMAGMGYASLGIRADDVFYCPLPFYHNNALTLSWGAVLSAGATLAIARKFSASRFWDDIRAADATAFCYIGELCRYLLAQPASPKEREHRVRLCVGNGLRPELWQPFRERFGIERINEFYGASEGNLVFTNAFDIEGSCGFCPLSYAIVAYDAEADAPRRDKKGHLIKVAKGEAGLLLSEVTDTATYEGYTDADESAKKLIRDAFKRGDCWFNTGDLVRDLGFRHIQFVDRVGDTFRWKGENVATTEVEAAFGDFAAVAEAVVYGVAVPGADGRAGMAALSLAPGATLDGAALAQHLRTRLPAYAVPVFLRVRVTLETTSTFKHRKAELRGEGFDPNSVGDALYVLRDDGYEPLTPGLHRRIQSGALRF